MAISITGRRPEEAGGGKSSRAIAKPPGRLGRGRLRISARKAGTIVIGATVAALAIVAIASRAPALGGDKAPQSTTKADYLYRFAPFVQWPQQAFARADAPLFICILGEDPFGHALDDAVKDRFVKGHPVIVERIGQFGPDTLCHILYVSRSGNQDVGAILHDATGRPILTVTDYVAGAPGGIIQFIVQNGRVRFMIDAHAAQAQRLQISAKLLELALWGEP